MRLSFLLQISCILQTQKICMSVCKAWKLSEQDADPSFCHQISHIILLARQVAFHEM